MSKGSSSMRDSGGVRGGSRRALPPDERLVMPETRHEVLDGRVARVSPADEPHGSRHSKISALVEAHVIDGYDVAADMLTRTSETSDFAPDVSVFERARDPKTGGRKLEEIAFEILGKQRLGVVTKKARALSERGVRRVFAIDVRKQRALRWSRRTGTWEMLPPDGAIDDPLFVTPLPIPALVGAARESDAVASALLARQNVVLVRESQRSRTEGRAEGRAEGRTEGRAEGWAEGRSEGRAEGRAEGLAAAVLVLLEARGFAPSAKVRARVLGMTEPSTLEGWLRRAATAPTLARVFAGKTPSKKP